MYKREDTHSEGSLRRSSRLSDPRNMRRLSFWVSTFLFCALVLAFGGLLLVGNLAWAPAPAVIGPTPTDLQSENVTFESASGSRLSGWFIRGQPRIGSVLLMHGIRANRLAMLDRARLLHQHGFSVLLFDFQSHGESQGRSITFGYLESLDAQAAFEYLRGRTPGERIGIIGVSLGGVDRKSTRLNSSHLGISYAVFCLKKKK